MTDYHLNAAPNRTDRIVIFGLLIVFAALYFSPLSVRPLARPDEVRYAEIAREMIDSGDWVAPRFNGVRYFEKPVMGHWLNAGSFELFGQNAFALRLPAALATGLTALFVYLLMSSLATRRAALMAAGIYLTTFEVLSIGTFAVFDSLLTLFLTGALAAYLAAHTSTEVWKRRLGFAACGLACGLAFLTKGFLGLLIPAIVIAPFLLVRRQWRSMLTTAWIPILVAVAVVLPWALAIHAREPDFWHYFVVVEHLQRFISDDAQHTAPWWYYIAYFPVAAFPWILLAPAAARYLTNRQNRELVLYLACWLFVPVLFFSLSRGKLMTYVLPCFVPLSMLLALGLDRAADAGRLLNLKWLSPIYLALFALALAALVAAQTGTLGEPVYSTGEASSIAAIIATLLIATAAMILAVRPRKTWPQMLLIACAILPPFMFVNFALPTQVTDSKAPGAFLEQLQPLDQNTLLISDGSLFGSLSWFLRRDDIYVVGAGEIAYGLSYPDARHRNLDRTGLAKLLAEHAGHRDIVIFHDKDYESAFAGLLPPGAKRVQRGELVLWRIAKTPHG